MAIVNALHHEGRPSRSGLFFAEIVYCAYEQTAIRMPASNQGQWQNRMA